jgi:hypothetical protein
MVTLCKKPPDFLEEPELEKPSDAQGPPTMPKGASPMTEIKSAGELQGIYPTLRKLVDAPTATPHPLTQLPCAPDIIPQDSTPPIIPGEDRAHVPFRLSELKKIK